MSDQPPGMSSEALRNGTGKEWPQWVEILDGIGATSMDHTAIARHIRDTYALSTWWSQAVAIGYEDVKGMRPRGMTSDGFAANASKTFDLPVHVLWRHVAEDELRALWLDPGLLTASSAKEDRTFNARWNADDSRVSATFTAKGEARSSLSLQHRRLASQEQIPETKAFWKDALARLADVVGRGS
ncbi:hypothetical protein [Brachybacterium sp. YJGR34]|uniref:hypothetical protein n=1 Tax=Brachybacterium sp. YJGR34 TaxID=2059911 RepID=UPI0018E5ABDF|nr:hypothetical protein [Brachybacterium sp. YJGR34]